MGCSSSQTTAMWIPHSSTVSFRHPLLQHGAPLQAAGNLSSSAWSTSCPSFFTDLDVCRAVRQIFSLHTSSSCGIAALFPFLMMLSQRRCHLMGSAVAGSGPGSTGHVGTFWHLLKEHLCSPPLPKAFYTNPVPTPTQSSGQDYEQVH